MNKTLYDIYLRGNIFNPFTLKKMMKLQSENQKRMTTPQPTMFSSITRVFSRSKIEAPASPKTEPDDKTKASAMIPIKAAEAMRPASPPSDSPSSSSSPPPPLRPASTSSSLTSSASGENSGVPALKASGAQGGPSPLASLSLSGGSGGRDEESDDLDVVKIPKTKRDFELATVGDVAEWLRTVVGLDPDACDIARKNKIRGKTLWSMTKRDFTDCGFAFGDAAAIVDELAKVKEAERQQAKRAMGFAAADNDDDNDGESTAARGRPAKEADKHSLDFLDDEGYEDDDYGTGDGSAQKAGKYCNRDDVSVVYKGKLGLSEEYVPDVSCVDAVIRHEDELAERIPYVATIVKECQLSMESIKSGPKAKELIERYDLSDDEVFALVMYTYDIGLRGPSTQNFYYVLNETLRARSVNDTL